MIEQPLDRGCDREISDLNLEGEAVSPVADHLAALGVPFIFATGYPKWCKQDLHTTVPRLQKPFDSNTLADAVRNLTAGR